MSLRLRESRLAPRPGPLGRPRILVRVVLVATILVLAWFQGYSARGWLVILVAILWGALLPFFLRGFGRWLDRHVALRPWQRRLLLVAAGFVLLGGFAGGMILLLL